MGIRAGWALRSLPTQPFCRSMTLGISPVPQNHFNQTRFQKIPDFQNVLSLYALSHAAVRLNKHTVKVKLVFMHIPKQGGT